VLYLKLLEQPQPEVVVEVVVNPEWLVVQVS
jgi:hypothetical protein